MIESLLIKNIGLIEKMQINFGHGLNVLTGESGAGKSMILNAINFLSGKKIDKMNIRKNCDDALIEGTFFVDNESILKNLEQLGIEISEDNLVVIARKYSSGKVSNRVNGRSVTVGMLKQVCENLMEFHAQNENQKLFDAKNHIGILDRFCEKQISLPKQNLAAKIKQLRQIQNQIDGLTGQDNLNQRVMMLEFQIKEIEDANLIPNEEENLHARYKTLSNAKDLYEKMSQVMNLIYNAENFSARDIISHACQLLNEIKDDDSSHQNIFEVLESVLINLDDVKNEFANALSSYEEILENGLEQMKKIEERLDFLYSLKLKYKKSVDDLIEYAQILNNQYKNLIASSDKIKELEEKSCGLQNEILDLCEQLSSIRMDNAKIICVQLEKNLFELGMPHVKFEARFSRKDNFDENGFDQIEFFISTNKGEDLKPLAKISSGGEISRIMLAIKTVFVEDDNVSTIIFDEIDSGVSGKIAQMVAEKLQLISRNHQVICITHLVQIAAAADNHFLIKKISDENSTQTQICNLNDEKIINELARLLAGKNITDATLKAAQEIKESNKP